MQFHCPKVFGFLSLISLSRILNNSDIALLPLKLRCVTISTIDRIQFNTNATALTMITLKGLLASIHCFCVGCQLFCCSTRSRRCRRESSWGATCWVPMQPAAAAAVSSFIAHRNRQPDDTWRMTVVRLRHWS